jgi:sphingomyelin phosphodiesterase
VDLEKECSGTAPHWYGNFDNSLYGCGCSVETVTATAAFMHKTNSQPDFILFTGDATASGEIMANVMVIKDGLQACFSEHDTPLYIVLGNHDFPGSPVGPDAKAWYKNVSDAWGTRWLDEQAVADFSQFGYYSTNLPMAAAAALAGSNFTSTNTSSPIRLIALNTELFNHGNPYVIKGDTVQEALAHLDWLQATLAATKAAGQRAYVVGHVPIGMETAYGNDRRTPSTLRPYWLDLFAHRYQSIMDSSGEAVVAIQIFGHEHVDTFRLIGQKTVALTVPSLSTAYPRTNPTVRLWHHNVSAPSPHSVPSGGSGAVSGGSGGGGGGGGDDGGGGGAAPALVASVVDYDQVLRTAL